MHAPLAELVPFSVVALVEREVADDLLCVLHQRQDRLAVQPALAQTLVLA